MQLPETVTLAEATALLAQVEASVAELTSPGVLRIDAGGLKVLDSAAVALMLEARRLAEQRRLGFEIQAAPAKLAALADLYGVSGLLSLSAEPERSVAT
jgi:phospholipid transport system transporter-binding protein